MQREGVSECRVVSSCLPIGVKVNSETASNFVLLDYSNVRV